MFVMSKMFTSFKSSFFSTGRFLSCLLLICLLFPLSFSLSAETLNLTLSSYLQKVKQGNVQNQLNLIQPSIQKAIYKEEKYVSGYVGTFAGNYSQNITDAPPSISQTGQGANFDLGWNYKFIETGTTVSATLRNQLSVGSFITFIDPTITSDSYWLNTLSLRVDQPLLSRGFIANENQRYLDVNKFNAQLSESQYNKDLAGLTAQAILLYWQYQINLENFSFQREQLQDSKEILQFNKRKEALGAINKTDVLENESQIINLEISLANAKKDLDVLKKNLMIFMGIPLKGNEDLDIRFNDKLEISKLDVDEDEVYSQAINRRDEIIDLGIQSEIAENALVLANLGFLPRLDAFVQFDVNGLGNDYFDAFNDFSLLNGLERNDVTFGLNLSLFTDIGAYRVPSERPNLLIEQAEKNYVLFTENLRREVFQRVREYKDAYQGYLKNEKNLAIQRRKFRLDGERYRRGEINFVAYIGSRTSLSVAHITFLGSKVSYLQSYINLELTQGTLLETVNLDKIPISQELSFE